MSNQSTLITDLPSHVVGGFQPARGVGEGWVAVDYATAEFSGTGLAAGWGSEAPELVLDLNLQGRHTLYFGLYCQTALRVWLDGEQGYREFATQHGGCGLQECRFHSADLTGRKLHIARKTGAAPHQAFVGFIRAEAAPQEYSSARNLVGTNDGWSWVALEGIESERDVWKFFTPLRDSDFDLMLWCPTGADYTSCHQTSVGTLAPFETTHKFRECDYRHAQQIKPFFQNGGDILKTAVAAAREVGVKLHFYIRPEAFFAPFPSDKAFASQFFLDHPEWHCRDEFGDEIMRLSYAFPQVQNHMLKYFEELLEYSPDGLCFAFNRSLPMMICEEPVLQEFECQNGRRPNLPDEVDSDGMVAARTTLMNGFFKRVRDLLSTRGLEFSCIVTPNEQELRISGLDLQSLAERKIFDAIMVHSGGFHAVSTPVWELPFWNELKQHARVYLNGWGGSYSHAETAQFLQQTIFGRGFAGGFYWDLENFSANPYNWELIRRGGSEPYRKEITDGVLTPPRILPLTSLRGVKLGRYNPMRSY